MSYREYHPQDMQPAETPGGAAAQPAVMRMTIKITRKNGTTDTHELVGVPSAKEQYNGSNT